MVSKSPQHTPANRELSAGCLRERFPRACKKCYCEQIMTTIALVATASSARARIAENTRRMRFECVSRINPQAGAKMERCKQEGLQMGLKPRGGAGGDGGGLRGHVQQACMRRRRTAPLRRLGLGVRNPYLSPLGRSQRLRRCRCAMRRMECSRCRG
jgi:hypothetical protein